MKLEVQEPPRPARTFVLTLTEDEASVLTVLLGNIGGQAAPRVLASDIWSALNDRFPDRAAETCKVNGAVFKLKNTAYQVVDFEPV